MVDQTNLYVNGLFISKPKPTNRDDNLCYAHDAAVIAEKEDSLPSLEQFIKKQVLLI